MVNLFRQAETYLEAGEHAKALKAWGAYIASQPNVEIGRINAGYCALKAGDVERMLEQLRALRRSGSRDPQIQAQLSESLPHLAQRTFEEPPPIAKRLAELGLELRSLLEPEDPAFAIAMAAHLELVGESTASEAFLEQAAPSVAKVCFCIQSRRIEEALTIVSGLLEGATSACPGLLLLAAGLLLLHGDEALAERCLLGALRKTLLPTRPSADDTVLPQALAKRLADGKLGGSETLSEAGWAILDYCMLHGRSAALPRRVMLGFSRQEPFATSLLLFEKFWGDLSSPRLDHFERMVEQFKDSRETLIGRVMALIEAFLETLSREALSLVTEVEGEQAIQYQCFLEYWIRRQGDHAWRAYLGIAHIQQSRGQEVLCAQAWYAAYRHHHKDSSVLEELQVRKQQYGPGVLAQIDQLIEAPDADVQKRWNEISENYEQQLVEPPRQMSALCKQIVTIAQRCQARSLLYLCCGAARELEIIHQQMPELRLTGLDISEGMLELAKRRCGAYADFLHLDATQADFSSSQFDIVMTISGLVLIEEAQPIIASMAKNGRYVLLAENYLYTDELDVKRLLLPKRWYHNYPALMEQAGLEVGKHSDFEELGLRLFEGQA